MILPNVFELEGSGGSNCKFEGSLCKFIRDIADQKFSFNEKEPGVFQKLTQVVLTEKQTNIPCS